MEKDIYEKLDDLSREFYNSFIESVINVQFDYDFSKALMIRIPAKNQDFGDMKIYLDTDEITVGLGEHFHTHFDRYSYQDEISNNDVRRNIILDTLEFINEVLNDKILQEVEMQGDKLISSSVTYLGKTQNGYTKMMTLPGLVRKLFKKDKIKMQYVWSGIYKNSMNNLGGNK